MKSEVTSEIRVYMPHVRAAHLCASGLKAFFRKYDLDLADFLKNGISAETLRKVGDPLGLKAVAQAEREHANGR